MNEAEYGFDYCAIHGGKKDHARDEEKRMYHLTQARYRARLAHFAEHDNVKSLRDEIALARMLIEARFNLIKSDTDLILHMGELNRMLLTMERLVKSAHSIEQNLGVLLARDAVLRVGQQVCEMLVEELANVPDFENVIDRLTERIITTIANTTNTKPAEVPKLPAPGPNDDAIEGEIE